MIKITRFKYSILISGHANYAEPGKDIVCAGISALAQTLIRSLEELTTTEIKYVMQPGTVDISYKNLSEHARALVDSFFIGCELIAREYPENVQIVQAWKTLKATEKL